VAVRPQKIHLNPLHPRCPTLRLVINIFAKRGYGFSNDRTRGYQADKEFFFPSASARQLLSKIIFNQSNSITMSKSTFFSVLMLCTLLFAACQQTPEPKPSAVQETPKLDLAAIKAEIQTLENDWAKASNAGDIATIVAFYADDAISMTNNKPMITGKAAIKAEM